MAEYQKFCRVNYWRINDGVMTSCSSTDDWDRCDVAPLSTYSSYGTQSFSKDEIYRKDQLMSLLQDVFDLGRRAQLRDIQSTLGIRS